MGGGWRVVSQVFTNTVHWRKQGVPNVVLFIGRVMKRADLLPGKEKNFPSSCWDGKVETYSCWRPKLWVGLFQFGVIDNEVVSHKSSPYRPS